MYTPHLFAAALLSSTVALAAGGSVAGKVAREGDARQLVVYVEHVPGAEPKKGKLVNTQKNSSFTPEVMVVRAGTTVDFLNEDKIYHNVFSLTPGNAFDLGLYRGGTSKATTLQEPGEVDVFCNIHPDMVAKVLVLQNDFHTEVKPDGTYDISGLPPGDYTVVAWSPDHKPEKKKVRVAEGGKASADFALKRRPASRQHLNKDGEQYGRYK
jgi:plastocyanin